jgi:type II restriction/modification system DNA methylase subunit YeeA
VRQIIEEYLMREEQQYKHHEKNIVSFNSKKKKLADDMSKTLDNILIAQRVLDEILSNNFQSKELFLYKLWFGEVMQDGGFDVVIGNPPYIRQEKIKELKPKLQIEGYKSYNGTADIYVYFFEQGYRLLKEGGNLSFITSNKYTRAKYGKEFRDFVLKNTDILEYIDFNGVKVFESATVDTSILSFRKRADNMMVGVVPRGYQNKNDTGQPQGIAPTFLYCDVKSDYKGEDLSDYCQKNGFLYAQNDLTLDSFSFANPAELKIKKKIEAIGTPLKEWDIKINYGIKTGFNEAFIISQEKRDELIAKDPKSAEIIKPILRGRDIKRYGYEFACLYVIGTFPSLKLKIDDYPAIRDYLLSFGNRLNQSGEVGSRKKTGNKWFETQDQIAYWQEFEKEKIVYPNMTKYRPFLYDNNGYYTNQKCFIMNGESKELKFIIALLNSWLFEFAFKDYFPKLLGGTIELSKVFFELIPLPKIPQEAQKPFIDLVDKIMELKAKNEETKELENQIDEMVYELYGLSEDEIKVVEGRE